MALLTLMETEVVKRESVTPAEYLKNLARELKTSGINLSFKYTSLEGKGGYTVTATQDRKGTEARPLASRAVQTALRTGLWAASVDTAAIDVAAVDDKAWISKKSLKTLIEKCDLFNRNADELAVDTIIERNHLAYEFKGALVSQLASRSVA